MAQAIICHSDEGLIMAADSLTLQEAPGDRVTRVTGCRLCALGTHVVLLAAGPPVASQLGEGLATWLQARGLVDPEDVLAMSRDFLGEGYARFLRGAAPEPPPRHLYFIIGGHLSEGSMPERQVRLLHSEAGELPFEETPLGRVFSLPRRLALEGRIMRQVAEGASLQSLTGYCLQRLASVAERNPQSVAGPYQAAVVTSSGIRFVEETG